jgi:stage III sporulation protein AE
VKAASKDNDLKDSASKLQEDSKIESLYDYIVGMKNEYDIMKDLKPKDYVNSFLKTGNGTINASKITKVVTEFVFKELQASIKIIVIIIIIVVLAALIHNLQGAFTNEKLSNIAYFSCYSLLIIVVSQSFYIGVDLAKETIVKMTGFMAALIPVLMFLLASVGGVAEAAVLDPIVIGAVNIGARIYVNLIIPMILMGFVLQFVNNISEEYKIDRLTKLINQLALWAQGILMTIFIGIMTIRGITTKTIDEVTVKVSKYAIDNFVPIVGKSLSDAISTVAGYSLLLKNALSGLGLMIIVGIVLLPIIKIFIMSLLFKFTAALVEPISDKRIVSVITAAGESLVLIMSCLISVSVMFFIMVSIIATTGKAIMG